MAILDSISGKRVIKRTQLHVMDNSDFEFRKLKVLDGFLVETENEAVKRAWMLPYKIQKRFGGYKSIGADSVTVCYDRDILLDTFGQMKDSEKPERGKNLKKQFVRDIATATCYKHEAGKKGLQLIDKMIIFIGTTIILEVIGILIIVAKR